MSSRFSPFYRTISILLISQVVTSFSSEAQLDFKSTLPIVKISTTQEIVDEPKVNGRMQIIWDNSGALNSPFDDNYEYNGLIAIEKRGQTSQFLFPKNGYAIETRDSLNEDLDVSFLGFPEEEDWILHGPYSDKTLLRNALAMHLGSATGRYHSRTRLVELILNGNYHGVYLLMEKIKQDKSRVDIAKLKPEDVSGDELTGGYVFKIDKGFPHWYSNYQIWQRDDYTAFQYVSPKLSKITNPQQDYIKSYVDSFEQALYSDDFAYAGKRYDEYIDIESFADHFILKELAKDVDAYRISSYYYKDKDSKGGKLTAGPAWDFNIAFGNINYCDGGSSGGWMYYTNCDAGIPFWWSRLMEDTKYRNTLKCRWMELSEQGFHKDSIYRFIDDKVELLDNAVDRNFERWPVLNEGVWPNAVVTGDYNEEIAYLKRFVSDRWDWLDRNMPGTCDLADTNSKLKQKPHLSIFPNPTTEYLNIIGENLVEMKSLYIIDQLGRNIQVYNFQEGYGSGKIKLSISILTEGLYTLLIRTTMHTSSMNFLVAP